MSEQLLVTLGVQDKGAKTQINALNKELRLLDKEFKITDKASKKFEDGTGSLGKKLDTLNNKYDTQKTKLEIYKKQINTTKQQLDQKKQALENLSKAEGDNEKQIQQLTKEINKMELDIRNATREMSLTETQMQELEAEIKDVEGAIKNKPFETMKKDLQSLGQQVEDTGAKLESIGSGMNSVGNALISMSAPIVGFGAYAIKATMDFEAGMSEVQAISGATGKDLELLEAKAKEMGKSTSKSATESAAALKYMALAGWDTQQMLTGIEPILRLSEAGNIDLARASDLVTDSMSALGVQVQDLDTYLDIVAQTQRKANTGADAMLEAYMGVGGTMKNLKVPLEESATWLGVLANRGIKGSEAGNALNSTLVNLMGVGGQAAEALGVLGVTAWDAQGNFKGIEGTLRELEKALASCTEEQRNQFVAMIGGKTQMDTLNAMLSGLNEEYTDLKAAIGESNGALGEMAQTMQDNTKGNITRLKSELEGLAIQVGEKLLPHVNNFIAGLSDLINWFGNLDEGTQKTIMKMGALAFGMGSTLKVLGTFTSGLGGTVGTLGRFIGGMADSAKATDGMKKSTNGVVGLLGKLAGGAATAGKASAGLGTATAGASGAIKALAGGLSLTNPIILGLGAGVAALGGAMYTSKVHTDLLGKSAATAKEDLGGFEKVIAGLTGVTFESAEALEKAGVRAKGFSENVSEEFQTAVKESEKNINDLTNSLREVNIDDKITKEESASFKGRVKEMTDGAIEIIKGDQEKSQEELKKMFMLSDGSISEAEQKTLDFLNKKSNTVIESIKADEKSIYDILKKGLEEKGYLNEEEIAQIQAHLTDIAQAKLESQATNQDELLASQAEFIARVKNTDLEEASALLAEKATMRNEEMARIQESYNTQIEMLKLKNRDATEEERINNEAVIASLEEQKGKELSKEQEKFNEYLKIIEENNPKVLEKINTFNGEVLTKADQRAQGELTELKELYPQMYGVTETGMHRLLNTINGRYEEVFVTVDNTTGQIIGAWSKTQNQTGGFTEQMSKDAKKMGQEHAKTAYEITERLNALQGAFVSADGKIVDANGTVIASLKTFQEEADGTGQGILELNGKKIKIESNTEGQITNFQNLRNEINNLPTQKTVKVKYVKYEETLTGQIRNHTQQGLGRMVMPQAEPVSYGFDTQMFSDVMPMQDTAALFENKIWGGGLFSQGSKDSKEISNIISPKREQGTKKSSQPQINMQELATTIATAVAQAIQDITLQADVTLDNGALVGQVSNGLARSIKRRR